MAAILIFRTLIVVLYMDFKIAYTYKMNRLNVTDLRIPILICFFFMMMISCDHRINEPEEPDEKIELNGRRMGALIVYMDPGIDRERADSVFRAAKELGITWVRIGFIWAVMNPQKDRYDFEEIDRIIDCACRYGLSVLPVFTWTPLWASSNPQSSRYMFYAPTPEKTGDYDAGLGTVGTGYDYMAGFAEIVSRRYKDKISCWELWNEPDMSGFYSSSVNEYCRMLHYFNHAVKKGNPEAQIVFGGLAQGEKAWGCDTGFFAKALADKAYPVHDRFDIYNFHVNFKTPDDITRQIKENEMLLAGNKLQQKYWITEVSYTSDATHQSLPGFKNGEESLGTYISSAYHEALLTSAAEVICWAALHDYLPAQPESDPYKYSGLYTCDLKPKQAGDTLKKIASAPAAVPSRSVTYLPKSLPH
jgi:hypothetical protein